MKFKEFQKLLKIISKLFLQHEVISFGTVKMYRIEACRDVSECFSIP